ncbi:PREDICTED: uncharacterized protein LOC109589158 isoform X2 [Amphimedon queenslandica]|uniref:Uncharacterized protein n=1 Tax=Amphimedon queenslandica TaxID=400682 RepID=A0AAN0JV93_AMPQE|nr:PREDICTED: uncharacterized protein LOC109589158 isoform X2 [Amphimedon queenslandica]|eukprot:XP_019860833.1 PREDICTED: uncharacterized protein LOC109589158 isoform X2 [Amphimedon queenslandica]
MSFVNKPAKKEQQFTTEVNLISFLLRVDDHESQSTLVVDTATVFTATVDVQSIVAHSPSPYSSTSSTNSLILLLVLLPLQKSVLELHHPLLYYNNLRYQKIVLKRVRKRGCGQNRGALRAPNPFPVPHPCPTSSQILQPPMSIMKVVPLLQLRPTIQR